MAKRKIFGNKAGIITVAVLIAVGLSALFGFITKGFTDFDVRELNPDNLINVEAYNDTLEDKRDDGLAITVSEEGEITVEGKNKTEADVMIAIQDVTLEVGKYTISSGVKNTDEDTYYLSIVNGEETIIADMEEDSTFTIATNDTTCTVYIVVCAGENVDATFRPVLVEGSSAGDFYTIGK
ncbi:MAG: hypothetical protein IJZ04_01560 [Clostridia bacterium]|nr:hypothetical protein [Clostridia bacterium]